MGRPFSLLRDKLEPSESKSSPRPFPHTSFHTIATPGPQSFSSGRVVQFTVNQQRTHCAIVHDPGVLSQPGDSQITRSQQLWNIASGEVQWEGTVNLLSADHPPAFTPDGRKVGFIDLNGVNLIALQPDNTTEMERISIFPSILVAQADFRRLSIGPEAKRIALAYQSEGHVRLESESALNEGRTKIDRIHLNAVEVVAAYYSESGKFHFCMSFDTPSLVRIHKFDFETTSLSVSKCELPFESSWDLQFHGEIEWFGDSIASSSEVGRVFVHYTENQWPRMLGLLRNGSKKGRVVVIIPQRDHKEPRWLRLSDYEEVLVSEGRVFVIDHQRGTVSEWDGGSRRQVMATFLPRTTAQLEECLPVVRFRDGRLVYLAKQTGEFKLIETNVNEMSEMSNTI